MMIFKEQHIDLQNNNKKNTYQDLTLKSVLFFDKPFTLPDKLWNLADRRTGICLPYKNNSISFFARMAVTYLLLWDPGFYTTPIALFGMRLFLCPQTY
jgi:hypothetical protein